jgi:hypothetical protein
MGNAPAAIHFHPGIEGIRHLILTMKALMESVQPAIQPETRDTPIVKPAIIIMKAVEETINWLCGV